MMILRICILTFLFSAICCPARADGPFGPDTPYYKAIPNLIETVGNKVTDAGEGRPLLEFYRGKDDYLPQFLREWIKAVAETQYQTFPDYNIDGFVALEKKWSEILLEYPRLRILEEIVNPILEDMIAGLPKLRPPRPGEAPWQNMADLYKELEDQNPWAVGAFFHIIQELRAKKACSVHEDKQVVTENGVEKEKILHREVILRINDELVFYELTINDKVVERFILQQKPTFMHEVLEEMRENGEDPKLTWAVAQLVDLMDYYLDKIGYEPPPLYSRIIDDPFGC